MPTTTVGVALAVLAPTGDCNSQHLIHISSHRWAFQPEIGLSQPIGDWFVEGAAHVFIFTDNDNYSGQDPVWAIQAHAGCGFGPNFWLAADTAHYVGGATSLDGVAAHNFQSVTRYQIHGFGTARRRILSEGVRGSWLTARNGGAFDRIGLTPAIPLVRSLKPRDGGAN